MDLPNLNTHKSLSDCVYDEIYKQIVNGKLKPYDKITESQVSKSMNISRAPVREALQRLAVDKLVTRVPRSGWFVSKLTPEEAIEIYEIRKRLECLALEFSFDQFDMVKLKKLQIEFQKCLKLEPTKFVKEALRLDTQLHDAICYTTKKKNLQDMLEMLRARVRMFMIRETNYIEHAKGGLQEHMAILDAILDGDRERALQSLSVHIEHAKEDVQRAVSERK